MKKKTLITIIVLVLIAVVFYLILENNKEQNQAEVELVAQENTEVAVRTAEIRRENLSQSFSVNGTFLPKKEAEISAEVGGQLVAFYVEEGDTVSPGQLVARLGGDKLDVSTTNAKAVLDNAMSTLKRYEEAYKTGGVTEMQLDQAHLQVENAQANYRAAQLNSGDTSIRSKVSGIVNKKLVEIGAVVGPGTPVLEVVDISELKLRVEVDEAQVSELEIGSTVKVLPSVLRDTLTGKVSFIAPASNGSLKFPVEISIDNEKGRLRAGMYATAFFGTNDMIEALVVPREAFVGSVSASEIFIVRDGKAFLEKIATGQNFGGKVEVVGGLKEGDVVVVGGQINLSDSTKVKSLD